MARTAKSKSKSAGVKAKKAKKKSIGKKAMASIPAVLGTAIGVISTITITKEMKKALKTGAPGVKFKFCYVGSYKDKKLKNKLVKFNNNTDVKMLITFGGNKTYNAAKKWFGKDFVSMVGAVPTNPPALCKGGVTLISTAGNKDRVSHLTTKGMSKSQVGLLCNPNSAMNSIEEEDWVKNIGMSKKNIFHTGMDGTTTDENDSDTYEDGFADAVKSKMQALIVSADPFFQETMDELVSEANKSGIYVTYPLQDYKNAWEPPTTGCATLQGPDLLDAYSQLAMMAASVLNQGTNPGFVNATSVTNDI